MDKMYSAHTRLAMCQDNCYPLNCHPHPVNCHEDNFHPKQLPPRKSATRTTVTYDNRHPDNEKLSEKRNVYFNNCKILKWSLFVCCCSVLPLLTIL